LFTNHVKRILDGPSHIAHVWRSKIPSGDFAESASQRARDFFFRKKSLARAYAQELTKLI